MKIGMFDYMQKNGPPKLPYCDLYDQHLEIVELGDQAGMDFYFVAEHHFDLGFAECPSPGVIIGAASQRTKKIRLGPLGYVLPFWSPVRLAEEIALLDNLTRGRLECGLGNGATSFSFAAYNVPWEKKSEIMWEAFEVMKGVWDNRVFDYEGKYFTCRNVQLGIPLVQKPYPPFWLPTRNVESIKEAASRGMSTVQWCVPRTQVVRGLFDRYREVYESVKPPGRQPFFAMMREIYVAETDCRARDDAKEHWEYFWKRYGGGRSYAEIKQPENIGVSREQRRKELLDIDVSIEDNSFICGSPETVAKQIKRLMADVGADCFLGDFAFGGLEHKQVMKSLQLYIEHVMPELNN